MSFSTSCPPHNSTFSSRFGNGYLAIVSNPQSAGAGELINRMPDLDRRFPYSFEAKPDSSTQNKPRQLGKVQQDQVLSGFNQTDRALPQMGVQALFEAQVRKHPHRLALAYAECTLTYQQLNDKANQLAHYLVKSGLQPARLAAIWLDRSPEFIIAILAILKTGAAYLPLDTYAPADRLAFILEDAGADLVIGSGAREPMSGLFIDLAALAPQLVLESTADLNVPVAPDALAYVMYTSGTTGQPNGVEVTQQGITRLVYNTSYFPFEGQHTFLQLASPSFDAATFEIWGALLHGNPCILYPGKLPEVQVLKKVIEANSIDCLWLTASLFNFIIDESPETLAGVSWILTGGEALSVPHVRKAQQLLPHTQLVNGYGPTENTTFTCCYPIPALNDRKLTSIPIGGPIANTQVYILDADLNPLPIGEVGELYTGGKGLARGYRNRVELTAKKFIQNPFSPDPTSKLYKTGDLGRWLPDGTIEFMGRVDKQVKIRGFRIEPAEIEQVILQDAAIRNCVVVVKELAGQKELVAYFVLADQPIDHQALNARLKKELPSYMVPASLVSLAQLPLTLNGKIDQARLPLPTRTIGIAKEASAPVTPTEQWLLQIWQDVFGNDAIQTSDNFFELGGHSLMAARLVTRINKTGAVTLALSDLFQSPTVQSLAQSIDQNRKVNGFIVPLRPGAGTPVFLFAGLGGNPFSYRAFMKHYPANQPVYGVFYPGSTQSFPSLQAYVAELVKEINSLTGGGPCSLMGYSLGGRVAFETAVQLQEEKKVVDRLCILSAYPPEFYEQGDTLTSLLQFNWGVFRQSAAQQKLDYILHRVPALVSKLIRTKFFNQPVDKLSVQYAEESILPLWKAYKTQCRFKGNLLLVKEAHAWLDPAFSEFYFSHIHPDLLWSNYIDGTIQVRTVSCGHDEILSEDFVQEVSAIYQSL